MAERVAGAPDALPAPGGPAPVTLSGLHRLARARLAGAGVAEPGADARLLVEHVTGTERIDAIRDPDRRVGAGAVAALEAALERRLAGEPVHRILGWRGFRGLTLRLSPETLEPRPDTETLVDAALPRLRAIAARKGRCTILDLGTGTGAVALALLSELPEAVADASDISAGALATAAQNAGRLGLSGRFRPVLSDWFGKIDGRYDAIVSNPPYIESGGIAALAREVRLHDPPAALDGGTDGLDAYRVIAAGAAVRLERGGFVAVEIGSRQGTAVEAIFRSAGFHPCEARHDLAGHERALVFML